MFQNTEMSAAISPFSWTQMIRAATVSRKRMMRVASALEAARLPYAVVGDHAVEFWVGRADPSAIRTSKDGGVGLVDESFIANLSPELRERLRMIFDTPEG
jgi:hypothetical protein